MLSAVDSEGWEPLGGFCLIGRGIAAGFWVGCGGGGLKRHGVAGDGCLCAIRLCLLGYRAKSSLRESLDFSRCLSNL